MDDIKSCKNKQQQNRGAVQSYPSSERGPLSPVSPQCIGAGDAMAAMAIAMAGIWRVHETATPGHHNRWHTLTFYYIKRDMKQGQIEVKMYICIK